MAQPLIDPDQLNLNQSTTGVGIFMPAGGLIPYAGSSPPGGYVLCNGQTLDSVANPQYAALYAAIGTAYGGSGPDDFDVPDLRGQVVTMVNTSGAFNVPLGTSVGNPDAAVVSHTHTAGGLTSGSHDHSVSLSGGSHDHSVSLSGGSHSHSVSGSTNFVPDHQHGDGANAGLPIVGAGSLAAGAGITNTDPAGGHSHSVSGSTNSQSVNVSGNTGSESINVSGNTGSESINVSGNTGPGSGEVSGTDRNIQPSFVLNYIISLGL